MGAVLQAIEDLNPPLRIVVRDYGLLITTESAAPQDALRLRDFWKPHPTISPP
jgi:hypothetical protein